MLATWHGKSWSHKLQIPIVYISFIYIAQANNEVRRTTLVLNQKQKRKIKIKTHIIIIIIIIYYSYYVFKK